MHEDRDIRLAKSIASAAAELYHAILETTSTGTITVDGDDLIVYANTEACRMWEYESSELVGNPISLLIPTLVQHLPARERASDRRGTLRALAGRELDVEGRTKSGSIVRIALSVRETRIGTTTLYTAALHDISDRLRYQEALVAAREQAEETARIRTALITNIGHEIRTPLTGILGFSNLLMEESTGEQREFAGLISKNTRRLLDTLNSVLELARLESPAGRDAKMAFDAVGVLRDVIHLITPSVPADAVTLTARTSHHKIVIESNPASLYSILNNLIGNAIKFTKTGAISVTLTAEADSLQIEVRDTGVGISREFLPRVYDEFTQESTGLTRNFEGSGLGLAIARRAVDHLGGEISVESDKGRGSLFSVRLPATPAASGDPQELRVP